MSKELIAKGVKKPHRIPSYVKEKMLRLLGKRVSFSHEEVVSGWGIKGAGLPHFSARLYAEIKLLNEAIGDYHAKRSIEIGCGYGRLTPWIAEHSDQHYAIEPESTLLNDALKLHPTVKFQQAKAQKLPFPDGFFDLCVSWTVLGHVLPKELSIAVDEIKRVCAPEAIIVLAEGVGNVKSNKFWQHPLEEYKMLFSPWKLTHHKTRKIEETYTSNAGLVMRFERTDK